MKRAGRFAAIALALVALFIGVVGGLAARDYEARYAKIWNVEGPALSVPYDDPAAIAHGEHLAKAVSACVECHGLDLGGRTFLDDPLLGYFAGSNLTKGKGGIGAKLTDADWSRAITRGVGHTRHSLEIMPARDFRTLSLRDVAAIIAWGRTRPPVDRQLPPVHVKPFGKFLNYIGEAVILSAEDVDPDRAPPQPIAPARSKEYGAYLAGTCTGCHRLGYNGGPMVGTPPGCPNPANLTPTGFHDYTEQEFFRAIRTGQARDGHALNKFMPWQAFARMTDDELAAIFLFLKSLPPAPTGS